MCKKFKGTPQIFGGPFFVEMYFAEMLGIKYIKN